ncbi:MAG: flavin reductase [Deltaproteobacteria bacterium]|nr:MAG: flavin reductase [Deltaproteobacteria bacterium]
MNASDFRRAMGNFATGVTVVTTAREGRFYGFTANSLTAVSLDPLLLLVCVDRGGEAHREMESCAAFAVNILASDQKDLSNHFASRDTSGGDRLAGVPFRCGKTGAPVLDGALAVLECVKADRLDGGDHSIFIGRVEAGEIDPAQRDALVYFRGAYRSLGSE